MAAPAVVRAVHPSGWFADVPADCAAWVQDAATTLTICPADYDAPHAALSMRGIVLVQNASHTVLSCAGLIVSVPNALLEEPAPREDAGAVAVFRAGVDAAPERVLRRRPRAPPSLRAPP